jgi:hypothetical protein
MKHFYLLFISFYFIYNSSFTQPKFSQVQDKGILDNVSINEASGLDASSISKDVLFTHNDSGGEPKVFAININGKFLGSINLNDLTNRDWEDITIGSGPDPSKEYIYIGEIGDNNSQYEIKYVYRFIEPTFLSSQSPKDVSISQVDKLSFVYPDGKRDAETLMLDPLTKDLIIVSKRETNVNVYRWKYPQSIGKVDTLKLISTLNMSSIVGGDISSNGKEIIIKNYNQIYYWSRTNSESLENTFKKNPLSLPYTLEPQGESLCFSSDNNGYFTLSEESPLKTKPHLYYYGRLSSVVVQQELPFSIFKLFLN